MLRLTQAMNVMMATVDPITTARELIDELPKGASWDEILYRIEVRAAIERGIKESDAGLGTDTASVRAEYGLPE